MATIDMQDPSRTGPRERIGRIIQMNMDSPLKLCAAFKRAFGGLLALDNKEYLEVSPGLCHPACLPAVAGCCLDTLLIMHDHQSMCILHSLADAFQVCSMCPSLLSVLKSVASMRVCSMRLRAHAGLGSFRPQLGRD